MRNFVVLTKSFLQWDRLSLMESAATMSSLTFVATVLFLLILLIDSMSSCIVHSLVNDLIRLEVDISWTSWVIWQQTPNQPWLFLDCSLMITTLQIFWWMSHWYCKTICDVSVAIFMVSYFVYWVHEGHQNLLSCGLFGIKQHSLCKLNRKSHLERCIIGWWFHFCRIWKTVLYTSFLDLEEWPFTGEGVINCNKM